MTLEAAAPLLADIFRKAPGPFLEVFGRIRAKDPTKDRILLNYLQRKMHAVWELCERLGIPCRMIVLKPRQKGCTTFSGGLCYWVLRRRKTSACVIGGEYSQTFNAWRIIQNYHAQDTFNWDNTGTINAKRGQFSNGSELFPETAKDRDAGRSATIQFLLATEAARWSEEGVANAAEVLSGILKCVPLLAGTTVILESTAKGRSGDFYERWKDAFSADRFLAGETPPPGAYIAVFAPWFEFSDSAIPLTPAQKDEIQRTLDAEEWYHGEAELMRRLAHNNLSGRPQLGETDHGHDIWEQLAWRRYAIKEECKRSIDKFNQDYPESPDVAFLFSGRAYFNQFGLRRLRDGIASKPYTDGILEIQPGGSTPQFRQGASARENFFRVWEKPRVGHRYLVTIDPATGTLEPGAEDPDAHAVLVLRAGYFDPSGAWIKPAVVARIIPPCRWAISILAEQVWLLARYFGGPRGCLITPEANMDRGLIELLKQVGAQISHRKVWNKEESRITADLGFQTTEKSRGLILDKLDRAVREWDADGDGLDLWCEHAITQMETFVIKNSGRAEHEDGKHDDDVLALAIGIEHLPGATPLPEHAVTRPVPADILAQRAAQQGRYGGNGAAGLS